MSRATPRKSRHRQQPSGNGPRAVHAPAPTTGVSDYESDAAAAATAQPYYNNGNGNETEQEVTDTAVAAIATVTATVTATAATGASAPRLTRRRSDADLNMSVLRRYLPGLRSIMSVAANAVVYNFTATGTGWDKSNVEGTLFVCELEPLVVDVPPPAAPVVGETVSVPRACVFVLNRRGLENLVVDLIKVSDCEVADELLIFRLEAEGDDDTQAGQQQQQSTGKVIGLWVHADEQDTREHNANTIRAAWHQSRAAIDELMLGADGAGGSGSGSGAVGPEEEPEPVVQVAQGSVGRRLSITDLFGQRNGNG